MNVLAIAGGRIYAGYGDFDTNTGPIHIQSVSVADPLAGWTDHAVSETEQVAAYRTLSDGRVLAAHIDPRGSLGGGYAEGSSAGAWTDRVNRISSDGFHVFDIIEFDGNLFACGSVQHTPGDGISVPVVWQSGDGGASWAESMRGNAPVSGGELARFYAFVIADDKLFVREATGAQVTFARPVGGTWGVAAVDIPLGAPGVAWQGGFLIPQGAPFVRFGFWPFPLAFFDGATTTTIAAAVDGFSVGDDGALYLLAESDIRRTPAPGTPPSDVANFGQAADEVNCALAVLPGCTQAVVGTSGSRLKLVDL